MLLNLGDLREDYNRHKLLEDEAAADPFTQFGIWFQEAVEAKVPEPNAMFLATTTPDGRPSARVVLLKGVEANSFVFYTNYQSRKGREIAGNPHVALAFNWLAQHRQVRIEGLVKKLSTEISTKYYQSRPKGSQVGAWASPQSRVIPNRKYLEKKLLKMEEKFQGTERLPLPPFWGGYQVKPYAVEFWQGRTSRLHDRLFYTLEDGGSWKMVRLAP